MSKEKPLVSIVMNCYNGERFLKEAIDSIYSQDYDNWEIIFWDNGSSDNSAEIAKSYDEKLKYFKTKETSTLGVARNLAMKQVTGKYVTFLDCDDLYLLDRLTIQTNVMEANNSVMCFGSWIEINESGEVIKNHLIDTDRGNFFEKLLSKYNVNFQTLMINTYFLNENKFKFDPELTFSPDFNLIMQIALSNNISSISNFLAKYRVHNQSMTFKYKEDKYKDFFHTKKILCNHGAREKFPKFDLLYKALLCRIKFADCMKSKNFTSALFNLFLYFSLRIKIALFK